jgi:nucleotide-binding universal stress UspA family protein
MSTPNPSKPANGIGLRLEGVNFTRVLVPVDFSVCTLETLRYTKALVEKSDAVVDVLHVVQPSHGRHEAVVPGASLIRTLIDGARQELNKLVGMLWTNETKSPAFIRVREGRVDEVILREADATRASLIVMGMRDRSWMSRLLRRQTVKQVIQNSPCPVLVLRTGITGSDYLRLNSAFDSGKTDV